MHFLTGCETRQQSEPATLPALALSSPQPRLPKVESAGQDPSPPSTPARQLEEFGSLAELRSWVRGTDEAIVNLEGKLNYIHGKEREAVAKYNRMNARMRSLERAKQKELQHQELKEAARKRMEEETRNKKSFNQLLKEHLKCNKEIVFSLFFEKKRENGNERRIHRLQISEIASRHQQSLYEQNIEKANQVRQEQLRVRRNRERFMARKIEDIRKFKHSQEVLKAELTSRERALIQRLEQRESELLDKVSQTEEFRQKCQRQLGSYRQKRGSTKF